MKKLLIGLVLLLNFNYLYAAEEESEESENGFYYLLEDTSPIQNGLVYYEKDEKLMRLYGHQGLEGFKNFSFNVNTSSDLILNNSKDGTKMKIGRINQDECGKVENYKGEAFNLCLVKFSGKNKIEVESKKRPGGFTDANGFPQIPSIQKNFYFTLILKGKTVSKTDCIDHFLSCRL